MPIFPFQAVHGRWPIVVAPPDGHVSDEAADRHVDTAAGAEEAAFLEQVAQVAWPRNYLNASDVFTKVGLTS